MKIQKITALFMSLVMVLTACSVVYAGTPSQMQSSARFNTLETIYDANGNMIYEVIEIDGHYYYYEDAGSYTLIVDFARNSDFVNITYKEKNNDAIFHDTVEIGKLSQNPNTRIENDTNSIFIMAKESVFNGSLSLNQSYNAADYIEDISNNTVSTSDSAYMEIAAVSNTYGDAYGKLVDRYGWPFSNSLIDWSQQSKHMVYLYEEMDFNVSIKVTFNLFAGMAVAVAATILSVPTSVILWCFAVYSIGTAGWAIYEAFTGNTYNGTVINYKTARIDGVTLETEMRTRQHTIIIGNIDSYLNLDYEGNGINYYDHRIMMLIANNNCWW